MKVVMKKVIKAIGQTVSGIGAILTLSAAKVMNVSAFSGVRDGVNAAKTDDMPANLIGPDGVLTNITNTILYVVGIIAIVMLIVGGIKYVTSGGDKQKVTDAKNTILYAVLGLVIALLAFAIVNFVLNALGVQNPVKID